MNEEYVVENKWLVAATVMTPTIMEVLDTSVANVSLPHIQGSLSASLEEVTWVLTSYLVANAIAVPCSSFGKLSRRIAWLMGCSAPPKRPCIRRKNMRE